MWPTCAYASFVMSRYFRGEIYLYSPFWLNILDCKKKKEAEKRELLVSLSVHVCLLLIVTNLLFMGLLPLLFYVVFSSSFGICT